VKRRTIFVKLPVSLSGGISVNSHRRRQDRFDIAADRPTGISIDVDTDGIADLHAADLRLAVIGLDPEIVNRDDREHARAGRDVFADAHLAVGDDAVDRRSHRGVYEPWVDVGLLLVDKILGGAVRVETARFIHSDRAASAARYFPGFAPSAEGSGVGAHQGWARCISRLHGGGGGIGKAHVPPAVRECHGHDADRILSNCSYCARPRAPGGREHAPEGDSQSLGYEDVASFARVFRKVTGLAPGVYRKRFGLNAVSLDDLPQKEAPSPKFRIFAAATQPG